MTTENAIQRLVSSLVFLGIIGSLVVFNPLVQGVVGGILWHRDFQRATLVEYYESSFTEICPSYRDASTWDRWFDSTINRRSWCEDYLARL
jgi:hypothetical protein